MRKATHVAAGVLLATYFPLDPIMAISGAIFPDIDIVYDHRKLLHNMWFLMIAFAYNFSFGVGVLSHVLLDMLTVYGVALLWPISSSRFRLATFRTGGVVDRLLFYLFAVLIAVRLYGTVHTVGIDHAVQEVVQRLYHLTSYVQV